MDNIFEILIYGLIIISFLSGLFRKKNKTKKPPMPRSEIQDSTEPELTAVQTPQREEYDVLKEIENFFKVGDQETEQQQPQIAPQQQTVEKVEFEEHVQSDQWHQPTPSEHKFTDVWKEKQQELLEKTSKVDSGTEQQAAKFEKYLKRKETAASEISKKIKERLRNPASLKDYVIIAEIMGKPKSFKR
jgi:hypothetical protein